MSEGYEGGCYCGALRYRIAEKPTESGYCHCKICQRTSSAPVLAWFGMPIESFALIAGEPRVYKTSEQGERLFCGICGTQLLYRDSEGPQEVYVNTASLDDPDIAPPQKHIFTASRISWFDTADNLPRYDGHTAGD